MAVACAAIVPIAAVCPAAAAAQPAYPVFAGGGVVVTPKPGQETHLLFRIPEVPCTAHTHSVVRIGVFGFRRHTDKQTGVVRTRRWFAGARVTCHRHRLSSYWVGYDGSSILGAPPAPRDRIDVYVSGRPCGAVSVGDRYTGAQLMTACAEGGDEGGDVVGARLLLGARLVGTAPGAFTVAMQATVNGKPFPTVAPYRLRSQMRGRQSLVSARRVRPRRDTFRLAIR